MNRVSSLGASNAMMRQFLDIQKDMFNYSEQASTEKRSQNYAGIARNSEYVINLENVRSTIEKYRTNNKNEYVRQSASATALDSARDLMMEFRKSLLNYKKGGLDDENQVATVQKNAHDVMKSLEGLLNTKADGRYLYSGSRVYTEPADMQLGTLAQFQAKYDGTAVTYPTTREQQLSNVVTSESGDERDNHLQFQRDNGQNPPRSQITMSSAAQAAEYTVGSSITVTGAVDPANNGTWTVTAVNGAVLEVGTKMFTDSPGGVDAGASVSFGGEGTAEYPVNTADQLTFLRDDPATPGRSTMTTGTPGAFDNLNEGDIFTVTGAVPAENNGTFTVAEKNGDQIVIETKMMTDNTPNFAAAATPAAPMTFTDGGAGVDDSITLTAPAAFNGADGNPLPVGTRITLAGATVPTPPAPAPPTGTADNSGTYIITAVSPDGRTASVQAVGGGDAGFTAGPNTAATAQAQESTGTITANGYYKGDTLSRTHRIDNIRSYENDITAINPAFEKAFRAMGLIAQGVYGTEGGLDQNQDRIEQAKYLINSALNKVVEGTPPPDGIGGEQAPGSIESVEEQVGYNMVILDRIEKSHKNLSTAMANRIGDVENVDKTEVLTLLLNEQRVFQASIQSFARLSKLSLSNFL
ncbi:MAG: hypothetical protein ACYYKD_07060 [Rhodospirillales bacterium]